MIPFLPDEILSKIAQACLDGPRGLRLRSHRSAYTKCAFDGVPALFNVKLTNRMFYEEIWKAVKAGFDGRLDITHRELEFHKTFEQHRDTTAWLQPLVTTLEMRHQPGYFFRRDMVSSLLNDLPNLEQMIFHVSDSQSPNKELFLQGRLDQFLMDLARNGVYYDEDYVDEMAILRGRGVRFQISLNLTAARIGILTQFVTVLQVNEKDELEILSRKVLGN